MLFVGIGLVSGTALTIAGMNETGWWQAAIKVEPGAKLFEADINEVRSFSYTTTNMTLTAQRSKAGGQLAVQITFADNRAPQHCLSSPDLGGLLSSFALSKVIKQINTTEIDAKYPITLGFIDVKDAVIGAPIPSWKLFTSTDHATVAVETKSAAFEIDISPAILKKLETGCAELAQR